MKRRYNSARALENINRLRALIPEAQFTADILVGFPGEQEADFLDSVEFVDGAKLLDAHVFTFSRRFGTVAYDMPGQLPDAVKRERTRRMIAHKNAVRERSLENIVASGRALPSIFETRLGDEYIAHSDTFAEVRCHSDVDVRGQLLYVKPLRHENGVIYGQITKNT